MEVASVLALCEAPLEVAHHRQHCDHDAPSSQTTSRVNLRSCEAVFEAA